MKKRLHRYGWCFSSLCVLGLTCFYLLPFILGVVQTVVQYSPNVKWKGLRVYEALLRSSTFRLALKNTLSFMGVGLPLLLLFTIVLSYMMDKLMRQKVRGTSFWFAVHLLPMVLPSVMVTKVFDLLFAEFGVLNGLLVSWGEKPVKWLSSGWTFWLLCLIFWWKNTGYSMVVLFSGMQNVGKEQREAAALDGAGEVRIFWQIVLPQMLPFLRFILIMGVVGVFKLYKESYLLLGKDPCDEAYMLQNFLNNNFASLNFDRTMATSVVLFVMISIFLLAMFGLAGREDNQRNRKKRKGSTE